jgi:hypothetical protein
MMSITVATRRFTGYKYRLRLALITISKFSFLSWLGFTFLVLHLQSMEDKRGTKRAHSPSKEGSPPPDGAKTPPPVPSGSPSLLTSPSEVSSRCPCSPVWEQGGSSEKTLVVDLSSDEGYLIADVSRDEEFARRIFCDLNCDVLGLPGNGRIIILSDPDEEEEVHEKKAADAEAAPSSATRSPPPTASTADVDGTYESNTPDRATCSCSNGGDEAGLL